MMGGILYSEVSNPVICLPSGPNEMCSLATSPVALYGTHGLSRNAPNDSPMETPSLAGQFFAPPHDSCSVMEMRNYHQTELTNSLLWEA